MTGLVGKSLLSLLIFLLTEAGLKTVSAVSRADFCDPAALCRSHHDGGVGGGNDDYGGCVPHRLAACDGRCFSDVFSVFVEKNMFYSDDALEAVIGPGVVDFSQLEDGDGICVAESECASLRPVVKYSRLKLGDDLVPSWTCNDRCLPLNLGCDGVCDIRPYLSKKKQRRAKELRLFGESGGAPRRGSRARAGRAFGGGGSGLHGGGDEDDYRLKVRRPNEPGK